MDVAALLLDSWDRQCRIVKAVSGLVTEETRKALPSPDGWPLDFHLAHIHLVRRFWLSQFSPKHAEGLKSSFVDGWSTPIDDLDEIKALLAASDVAVREAVKEAIESGVTPNGAYDNPVIFLQHMVWHEGWHVGLLFLGLRLAGKEPPEVWEEANVWSEFRTEE